MNARELISEKAAWLLEPELAVCVVGSTALAEACIRSEISPPNAADLDLSWAIDPRLGSQLLAERGVEILTTVANQERGTLAMRLGGSRIEITSLRGDAGHTELETRIIADLQCRDMTVGALAWWLTQDRILDPMNGLQDWNEGRIAPCGDPSKRIPEHPVRWLRYYRRAKQWGFELDPSITKLELDPKLLRAVPAEVLAAEFRAVLLTTPSPGQYFAELFDAGLLQVIAPELSLQFDGRPAGRILHHPEGGQGEHMILALRWAREHSTHLSEADQCWVMVAVLCHDLGKGLTPPEKFPSHHGHERAGLLPLRSLLERLPGLCSPGARRLAEEVCALHLEARRLQDLRPGTLAGLYEKHFRRQDFRADLFALAVGADSGGRLGKAAEGERIRAQVQTDLEWLQNCCSRVDAGALRMQHPEQEDFRRALHEARAQAIAADRRGRTD